MPETTPLDHNEHVESAERAGLRYTTDADRGIRRVETEDGFAYVAPNGHPVRNEAKLRRIRGLAIPPAWTDVWICAHANGHLQVTARDAKGRKQYRYHAKYRAIRDETKFDRMLDFSRVLPITRERVEAHLGLRGLPREKVLATVVWLLERTLIRVGNIEYARDNETFGLTTMQDRHADIRGSRLDFSFRGKSGREHTVSITDRRLARIVQRCQDLPGEELFQYMTPDGRQLTVGSGDINDYLRFVSGERITAKDFRTWGGTNLAAVALREIGPVRLIRDRKANVIRAIDRVAERLGNTRAVCRKYYVHPIVLHAYMKGRVLPPTDLRDGEDRRAKGNGSGRRGVGPKLRADEEAVLRFIEEMKKRYS